MPQSNLQAERTFLMPFSGIGRLELMDGEAEAPIAGEAILTFAPEAEAPTSVRVERLGVAVGSIGTGSGRTGRFNVGGRDFTGTLTLLGDGVLRRLRAQGPSKVQYPLLTRQTMDLLDAASLSMETVPPQVELAVGARSEGLIEGWLERRPDEWALREARVEVAWRGGFGIPQVVSLVLDEAKLIPLDPVRPPIVSECNVPFFFLRRSLTFQPFGIGSSDADATGGSAPDQFARAREIWKKACVDIVMLERRVLLRPKLRSASNLRMLLELVEDSLPLNVIPVFFTEDKLAKRGGGFVLAEHTAVMITEPNHGNPVLLAHELGHVLNLPEAHSGGQSDPGSVMEVVGSATKPGPELVSFLMCTCVHHNWLKTLDRKPCSFTHDTADHFIARHRGDPGGGPAHVGAAAAFVDPDLWTARSASTTGSEEHEPPLRLSPEGAAAKNFVAVRVQKRSTIPTRKAVVRFFYRLPGCGGGFSALSPIRELEIREPPLVFPSIAAAPWVLGPGVPHHAAVYALVRSDAEPEGDLAALSHAEFEARVRATNDWAVRSLEVQDFAPPARMEVRRLESAPFIVRLPPGAVRLQLQVDASAAAGVAGAEMEVLGKSVFRLHPGRTTVEVTVEPAALPDLVVVLRAAAPEGTAVGSDFTVVVEPSVDGREMVGFACRFRAAPPQAVVGRVLDAAAAALRDLRDLAGAAAAAPLWESLRPLLAAPPTLPALAAALVRPVAEAGVDLSSLASEPVLAEPEMALFAPVQALHRWRETAVLFTAGAETPEAVVQAFGDVARRLVTATAFLAEKRKA